jgi:hypothetical protein
MQHQQLAEGGWSKLSLLEQLANVGSEVGRAAKWQNRDRTSYEAAYRRALELLDLTMQDVRWRHRLKEISRARELLIGAVSGEYETSLQDLDRYFMQFALAARLRK